MKLRYLLFSCLVSCLAAVPAPAQPVDDSALEKWLAHLENRLPADAAGCTSESADKVVEAAAAVDAWAGQVMFASLSNPRADLMTTIERLLLAKQRTDARLEATLALRTQFPTLAVDGPVDPRQAIRSWLVIQSRLIDLSGRLRYVLADIVNTAAYSWASQPARREALVDLLLAQKSPLGAVVLSAALFDPPAETPNRAVAATPAVKLKILRLIAETGQAAVMPELAGFVLAPETPAALKIAAAETIRAVGLPQDPRPGQADAELPAPDIGAVTLTAALEAIPAANLDAGVASRRQELLSWLAERQKQGLTEESYRLGHFDVRPGDWLLMRNPSPYNLFTDLSPGLFTHVGVVAMEQGSDGIRRMVVVDLPERGSQMPGTNVEVFVQRTLNYCFIRTADADAARRMGEIAASTIGNATEFDLNFRTDRVLELRGKPLTGVKIKTYCAGLLLLCAQETSLAREQFFPIPERVAGGNTAENLAKIGLSVGDDFISPTGALYSSQMSIVGRREPMYEPQREVEEAIFDHFAIGLESRVLVPAPSTQQALRLALAEAAKTNPALAAAMAQAAGVSADMDLVAAAKAAAVVETLDEIAYGHSQSFREAREALTVGPAETLADQEYTAEEIEQIQEYRRRHAELFRRWTNGELKPRELRLALTRHYIDQGQQAIDEAFFAAPATEEPANRARRQRRRPS